MRSKMNIPSNTHCHSTKKYHENMLKYHKIKSTRKLIRNTAIDEDKLTKLIDSLVEK